MKKIIIGKDMDKKNLKFNTGMELGDTITDEIKSPSTKLKIRKTNK